MKLYLLRHAHAEPGARDDASRGLTDKGRKQCKAMRQFIEDAGLKFDGIACSTFARALETLDALKLRHSDIESIRFAPSGDPEMAWLLLNQMIDVDKEDDTKILLVTHHPLIGKLVSSICFACSPDVEWIAHCTLIRLDTHPLPDEVHPLRWMVTPNLANRLQESELIEAARRLRKHLGHAEKAQLVDPLIRKLGDAIARRFRSQARAYKQNKSIDLPPTVNNSFQAAFNNHTRDAYQSGAWHVEQSLDPLKEAVKPRRKLPGYIARSADDLAADIDETSDEQLTSIVHSGEAEGLSTAAVTAAVLAKLHEWTGQRSNTIALNEISKAFHAGGADVADAVGDEVKQTGRYVERHWETQDDPCPECEQNEAAGWIGEDEQYPNFPDGPPGHPNCQCSESYRTAGGEE